MPEAITHTEGYDQRQLTIAVYSILVARSQGIYIYIHARMHTCMVEVRTVQIHLLSCLSSARQIGKLYVRPARTYNGILYIKYSAMFIILLKI